MIDINDLWIGDMLILKKSGRIGKYSGTLPNGKIKIAIGNKTILTTINNLSIAPKDEDEFMPNYIERPILQKQNPISFDNSIDLHIEILNPSLINSRPERIISFQVEKAKEFIEQAILFNTYKIEIIHGKGQGVLKSEILHLISLFDEINFTFDKNNGGATEIWFSK